MVVAYTTVRASHARQVKGDDPDKKGYPGPLVWELGVRLTTSPRKKNCYENLRRRPRPTQGCRADDDDDGFFYTLFVCICVSVGGGVLFLSVCVITY